MPLKAMGRSLTALLSQLTNRIRLTPTLRTEAQACAFPSSRRISMPAKVGSASSSASQASSICVGLRLTWDFLMAKELYTSCTASSHSSRFSLRPNDLAFKAQASNAASANVSLVDVGNSLSVVIFRLQSSFHTLVSPAPTHCDEVGGWAEPVSFQPLAGLQNDQEGRFLGF